MFLLDVFKNKSSKTNIRLRMNTNILKSPIKDNTFPARVSPFCVSYKWQESANSPSAYRSFKIKFSSTVFYITQEFFHSQLVYQVEILLSLIHI